jgi:TDG/mug DNA glycosylase family protein
MLPDLLRPGLRVVFVGTSVSTRSAAAGHYYSHPTNKFWQLLAHTGLPEGRSVGAPLDTTLPDMGIGLTDLDKNRAASSDALLAGSDYDVPGFLARIEVAAPIVVAFNGGNAADQVAKHLVQRKSTEGPADWKIGESLVYRLPSSSAAASINGDVKIEAWREFGSWVGKVAGTAD